MKPNVNRRLSQMLEHRRRYSTLDVPSPPPSPLLLGGTAPLPAELVLFILYTAAEVYPRVCVTLCRVSTWTRAIFQPMLLESVIFESPREVAIFSRCLQRPKGEKGAPQKVKDLEQNESPAALVQSLYIPDFPGPDTHLRALPDLLAACPRLHHLALSDRALYALVVPPRRRTFMRRLLSVFSRRRRSYHPPAPPPARPSSDCPDIHLTVHGGDDALWSLLELHFLMVSLPLSLHASGLTPLASRVTHLYLARDVLSLFLEEGTHLHGAFTRLTHVAVRCADDDAGAMALLGVDALDVLDPGRRLAMVVLVLGSPDGGGVEEVCAWLRGMRASHKTFFVAFEPRETYTYDPWLGLGVEADGARKQWMTEVRGAEGLWERAVRHSEEFDEAG